MLLLGAAHAVPCSINIDIALTDEGRCEGASAQSAAAASVIPLAITQSHHSSHLLIHAILLIVTIACSLPTASAR